MSHAGESSHYELAGSDGGKTRRISGLEAGVWITLWLACLMGMLAYLHISGGLTAWTWLALMLLALFYPSATVFKKAFGRRSDATESGDD